MQNTVAHDAVLKMKEPYLNVNFFTFRFVLVFGSVDIVFLFCLHGTP